MNILKRLFSRFKKDEIKKVSIKKRDSRRSFTITQRKEIWYVQKGKCKQCNKKLDMRTVIYDHVKRWSDGGSSSMKNCQALCPNCNNMKNYRENLNSAETRRIKGDAER